jgi:hypothetical protein
MRTSIKRLSKNKLTEDKAYLPAVIKSFLQRKNFKLIYVKYNQFFIQLFGRAKNFSVNHLSCIGR